MAIKFKQGYGGKDILRECYFLKGNPFKIASIYNPDNPGTYEPRMYGRQLDEFYDKFFMQPLMRETNRQVIGAIWSSQSASDWRGFGKSMLMAEEAKKVCSDFGGKLLASRGVTDDDVEANPILAGYCTFDQGKEIKTFASALLDAVAFILEQRYEEWTVHQELRIRIATSVGAEERFEGEAVRLALLQALRQYKGLNVQLNHKTLERFVDLLSDSKTDELTSFIRNEIGPRVKANQGFNFVHVFNAFARLAGIVSITYFVDQIENFAKWARNQDRDIKILRESICQTSPTAELASFVFQMHIHALQEIEDWWTAEHLPSLDFESPINKTRTVNLRGLQTTAEAETLAKCYLDEYRLPSDSIVSPLHPFPKEVIAAVRDAASGNPRKFLEKLGQIIDLAAQDKKETIDLFYVEPLLGDDYVDDTEDTADDDFENIER